MNEHQEKQTLFHQKISLGLNLIFCGYQNCLHNHSFGPAIRPHYLFHYILSGQGSLLINKATYSLKAGQGFMIYPGETTTYTADSENPWEYVWLAFEGPDADTLLTKCGLEAGNNCYTAINHLQVADLFKDLIISAKKEPSKDLLHLSKAYALFDAMSVNQPDLDEQAPASLQKAIHLIKSNYAYDLKVSDIARAVGLDRSYLYRLFIEGTGKSIQEFLISYRLKVAKQMMMDGSSFMTEIAYSCGFKSSSSFSRHFTRHFGISPKRYQKEYCK